MATALHAALWMCEQIKAHGRLAQNDAAKEIAELFGKEFVFVNENGNPGICEGVLKHFRIMTKRDVVWVKDGLYWRNRQPDEPYDHRRVI